MQYSKEIGCYNVIINDGHLNHEEGRWYYGLQIDRFEKEEWKDSNFFYIKGHKDGYEIPKHILQGAVHDWLEDLTEMEITKFYHYPRAYQFDIVMPTKVRLV